MPGHLLILSDTHLGRPRQAAHSADALRPLWQDAAHVIINGDLAELHHPDYRADAAREVLRLRELCAEDGVRLTVLSGNHDAHLTDLRHVLARDDRILITHGDALHPSIAPWSPEAARIEEAHDRAISRLDDPSAPTLAEWLSATQHAAHEEWLMRADHGASGSMWRIMLDPRCAWRVIWSWRNYPSLAAEFAGRFAPSAQLIVIGHTHRAGHWVVGDRVIMNTGSFGFPGRPHAVIVDGETASLWPIRVINRGHATRYALDTAPRTTIHLSAAHDSSAAPASAENTPVGAERSSAASTMRPASNSASSETSV